MKNEGHDRAYLQSRIREEIDRHRRYGHPFSVIVFEAHPVADGVSVRHKIDLGIAEARQRLRPSDVVSRVFEDTFAVLLVETDASGANDALFRLRNRLLTADRGSWTYAVFNYPGDARAILESPVMRAA